MARGDWGSVSTERTVLLVANRADPTGSFPLEDLPGAGGRFDLVARFVTACLLTSHGIREDTAAIVLFTRAEPDPVAVRIQGANAVGLRPDERSTAARLVKALEATAMPVWQDVGDGVELKATTLDGLLDELPEPLVHLHEVGTPIEEAPLQAGTFVLGDQDGLTSQQQEIVKGVVTARVSLGPVALQADQAVTVVHNVLDRA